MSPALLPGDVLLVSKLVYGPIVAGHRWPGWRAPARGDIVTFQGVESPHVAIVKRLVALPGDTVRMERGTLVINNLPIPEPYLEEVPIDPATDSIMSLRMKYWQKPFLIIQDFSASANEHPTSQTWGPLVVPPEQVMVLGDNRGESYDSRFWGFLPISRIRGTPLIIYFSYEPGTHSLRWSRFGKIPR